MISTIDRASPQDERKNYVESLKREVKMATGYLKRCVHALEELGLITREKRKNRRYIKLTARGREAAQHVRKLQQLTQGREEKSLLSALDLALFLLSLSLIGAMAFARPSITGAASLPDFYDAHSAAIDFLLYATLFLSLAQATLGRHFKGRSGRAVSVAVGLLLALGILRLQSELGFSIGSFGVFAALLLIGIVALLLFRALVRVGIGLLAAASTVYIILYLALNTITPEVLSAIQERAAWLPLALGILVVPAILIVLFGLVSRGRNTWSPPFQGGIKALPSSTSVGGELVRQRKTANRLLSELRRLKNAVRAQGQDALPALRNFVQEFTLEGTKLARSVNAVKARAGRMQNLDIAAYEKLKEKHSGVRLWRERRRLRKEIRIELARLDVEKKIGIYEDLLLKGERYAEGQLREAVKKLEAGDINWSIEQIGHAIESIRVVGAASSHLRRLETTLRRTAALKTL